MLKTICNFWQMLQQTNNFNASLFDKRVFDSWYNVIVAIVIKKMRKTFSNKKINNNQIWNDNERCEFDYCYYLTVTKRSCEVENLIITWLKKNCCWCRFIDKRQMTKIDDNDESFRQNVKNQLKKLWIAIDTI